ncbi:uncharacterized protein DNG_07679 [Cephalotrichum gorgonifer]|uniref:Uncharacterized protein n=1 Tax=Cephalotrichum gorgonifer TaxID=2041049 RepID=A0AAE8SXQ1_9PEZI|nr:uncharacterized protein DNG_07679 [Cephalotrichum gorgonifer]
MNQLDHRDAFGFTGWYDLPPASSDDFLLRTMTTRQVLRIPGKLAEGADIIGPMAKIAAPDYDHSGCREITSSNRITSP